MTEHLWRREDVTLIAYETMTDPFENLVCARRFPCMIKNLINQLFSTKLLCSCSLTRAVSKCVLEAGSQKQVILKKLQHKSL